MAENVGGSKIDITASSGQAEKTFRDFFKFLDRESKRMKKQMGDRSPFDEFTRQSDRMDSTIGRNLRNLPAHLKPFHQELNQTRRSFRDLDKQAGKSLDEMADAAVKAGTSLEKMTSVTDSGKRAVKAVDGIRESVKETQLAILGLNKDGNMRISAEDANKRLASFRGEIAETKRELERVRDAGDFASYAAGMEVVERKLADVDRAYLAASRGGDSYTRMVRELGVVTSDTANQSAIAMEAQKDKFLRNLKTMQAAATQSSKLIKILPETSNIQAVDRFFLGVSDKLEKIAKNGSAAAIAVQQLGEGASMKDIQDRITVINQGLARLPILAIAAGIAVAGFTAVMFNAAKGPNPADVLKAQGEALAEYAEAVNDRTNEIANAWTLFEEVQLKKISSKSLTENLQGQVDALNNWRGMIADIRQQAGDEFADHLAAMGPQAINEVKALSEMTGPELDNYVALWREKFALANEQAKSELEDLKIATDKKVAELQASLTPLGLAIERFQSTWATAVEPFVASWGNFAAKIVDVGTALGNVVNKINAINPAITATAGNFAYLTTVFSLLLLPMSIGIGRAKSFQAAFALVLTTGKMFIVGFARVIGIASIVAAVITILVGVFMRLYQNSEQFRKALAGLWTALRNLGTTAAAPLIKAFQTIGAEFTKLINQMVGSKGSSMTSFWQRAGDLIAVAINKITAAFQYIGPVVSVVFGFMATFIVQTFRSIVAVVKSGIAIITNTIDLFKNLASGNFKGAWENIKAIFTNALIFIWNYMQLMFFGRVLGLFRGFAKSGLAILRAGWTGIRTLAVSLFGAVRDFIVRIFTGINTRTVGISRSLYNGIAAVFRAIQTTIRGILNSIAAFFRTIFGGIHSFVSGRVELTRRVVVNTFRAVLNLVVGILRSLLNGVTSIFRSMWTGITGFMSSIGSGIRGGWNSIFKFTKDILGSIWKFISDMFNKIVKGASDLPKRMGNGIKKMGGAAIAAAADLSNSIASWLGKGVNGIIGGINWVLGKINVKTKIPTWEVPKIAVPKYKDGTGKSGHKGGPALINDQKGSTFRELFRTPDGKVGMFSGRNVLADLPKGTSVLPAAQSKALLDGGFPAYKTGVGDFLKSLWGNAKSGAVKLFEKGKDAALGIYELASDPAALVRQVYEKFVPKTAVPGGALGEMAFGGMKTIKNGVVDYIKKKVADFAVDDSGGPIGDAGKVANVSGGVAGWRKYIIQVAQMMKEPITNAQINGILAQIQRESGGNQKIIQSSAVWDVNTAAGNPARGLLQYIPQTFNAYKVKGRGNIYSGIDQLFAFFNNTSWRKNLPYGKRGWGPTGARKYAKGGFFLDGPEAGIFGDGGPEMALPLIGKNMQPYAQAVAINLANMFSGAAGGAAGGERVEGPLIFQSVLNGRVIAEETFTDIQDLQNRQRAANNRARGRVDL